MNFDPNGTDGDIDKETPPNATEATVAQPYLSGSIRSVIVLGLFCIGIFISLVSIFFAVSQFDLFTRAVQGDALSDREFEINSLRQSGLDFAVLAQYLALVVAFFMWIYRAHANLAAIGATGLEFSPKGAVGWYFAPFFNLFKPYQVMREIYNASDPNDAIDGGDFWRTYDSPFLLKTWWGLFLLMNVFANSSARLSLNATTPADFQAASVAAIVSESIAIIAYLPAIWLVWSINRRQTERAAVIADASRIQVVTT